MNSGKARRAFPCFNQGTYEKKLCYNFYVIVECYITYFMP